MSVVRGRFRRVVMWVPLLVVLGLGLGLRVAVWQWHALYPLGGDERDYFEQALMLLREHRYVELRLMRPPLYTGFLAACVYVVDSLVQRLRLIQVVISTATIVPAYALVHACWGRRRDALLAALLVALNMTLAVNATELLTETVFLFGLMCLFWLLVRVQVGDGGGVLVGAALAGVTVGALVLVRSVALPLVPLGVLWLVVGRWRDAMGADVPLVRRLRFFRAPLVFVVMCALVVLPWTVRNMVRYGAVILVDTTGPENLWLDNDPAGREAVKRQLYALGDDRAGRQRLALARGVAAITGDPGRFAVKVWGEAQRFFALQFFDDLRDRRAIWVSPAEVWLRVVLGDGVWLVFLFGGVMGMWLMASERAAGIQRVLLDLRWLLVPWVLYTLVTALVFHVELRYRLPLYPALLPFAAGVPFRLVGRVRAARWWVRGGALLMGVAFVGLMLAHRSYVADAWMLGRKHVRLWQAERALASGDAGGARMAADAALALDADSALARVVLARAALLMGDQGAAMQALDSAEEVLPAHPYAHVVRGALLRMQGRATIARAELAYETATLEDMQGWAWDVYASFVPVPAAIDIGGGLDLGAVRGFSAPEVGGFRWSGAVSQVQLMAPAGSSVVALRLAPGRPFAVPRPSVTVTLGGRTLARFVLGDGWRTYRVALSAGGGPLVLTLRSDTFRPRDVDPTSPDGRTLGVMVGRAAIEGP